MAHAFVPKRRRRNAKSMRRVMTEIRAHRLMGLGFRRQVPIGPFVVDFACPTHRLIVEVDGSQYGRAEATEKDAERSSFLQARGWTILRFWNDDVLRSIGDVCQHFVIASGLSAADATLRAQAAQAETRL